MRWIHYIIESTRLYVSIDIIKVAWMKRSNKGIFRFCHSNALLGLWVSLFTLDEDASTSAYSLVWDDPVRPRICIIRTILFFGSLTPEVTGPRWISSWASGNSLIIYITQMHGSQHWAGIRKLLWNWHTCGLAAGQLLTHEICNVRNVFLGLVYDINCYVNNWFKSIVMGIRWQIRVLNQTRVALLLPFELRFHAGI